MDAMADREQRLERHHRLVVFAKIADDHQNPLAGHGRSSRLAAPCWRHYDGRSIQAPGRARVLSG